MENITVKNLTFSYPNCDNNAINDISFTVNNGEIVLVMGKSASGKSTLLKLLKKEIAPAGNLSGTININDSVGYVCQDIYQGIVTNKVRSELSFGIANLGYNYFEIEVAVAEIAAYFNLDDKLDCNISKLSGGQVQILNLASVMIMKPKILILDEPTAQLDPIWSTKFISVLKKINRDFGTTIIIAEHSVDNIFINSDKVLIIEKGNLISNNTPQNTVDFIKNNYSHMINSLPVEMTLYDNTYTIKQCQEIFNNSYIDNIIKPNNNNKQSKDEIILSAKNLYFAYVKGKDVLNSLNLKIYKGKINAIVGPNSSGKSTLLKAIANVYKPYNGKIKSNGKVSMLCQNVNDLFTQDTCDKEVNFGEITSYLKIDDIKNKHPYDLSGGQAQRLAIAKVLQKDADIILLDEPTKGLDYKLKEDLAKLLLDLCKKGKTIVIVAHDIEFVGRYSHYISFLSGGKIITTNKRKEFFSSLNFYTTTISKITNSMLKNVVSIDDFKRIGDSNEKD